MRQIKFRAWDKEKKEWYAPVHEAYKGNLWELMVGFSGDLLAHTMDGIEHQSKWPDRYELVQFTGLLDKNGKEIYEGDILVFTKGNGVKVYREPVAFSRGKFVCGKNDPNSHDNFPQYLGTPAFLRTHEVAGNIYENPELLTPPLTNPN